MKLEEKALFGLPIETAYGSFKPMSVRDYMDCAHFLQAMSFDKKRVLHEIRLAQDKDKRDSKELTAVLNKLNDEMDLREVILSFMPLYFNAYIEVLLRCKVFEDEVNDEAALFNKIKDYLLEIEPDGFEEIRLLLLAVNAQPEQTAWLDPEIQRFKEKAINFKKAKGNDEAPDPSTMVTTVVTYTGINFSRVINWNVTQLQHIFQRVALFISYDTYIKIATVAGGDKLETVNWAENIKTENDTHESYMIELSKFQDKMQKELT